MTPMVLNVVCVAVSALIALWIAGALLFDVGQGSWLGWLLVVAWGAAVVAMFSASSQWWQPLLAMLLILALTLLWWFSLKPSQTRNWDPNFAQLASVTVAGDEIIVSNVRNTEYRTMTDYTRRYETRTYRLSLLRQVDVLIQYWGSRWMCHPMFVFDFGIDGRLCISIEVRYRVDQRYDFFRSLYRQQELIYVVSDERDAILRRTQCLTGNDLYLYRFLGEPLEMRLFFLEYAARINDLAATPCWYHGLTTNCTTSIFAQGRGHIHWDWRMLFNGSLDRFLYDRGRLDRTLPFDKLKELSRVNDVANRAPADGFGDFIRRELPVYGSEIKSNELDVSQNQ